MKLGDMKIMNKTVLTLALLSGVYSFNMNTIYAGDPDKEKSQDSSFISGEMAIAPKNLDVSGRRFVEKKKEVEKIVEERVFFTNLRSVAVTFSGVATLGYMIAQPSYAGVALVPWMGYGALKLFSLVKAKYTDHVKIVKGPLSLVSKYSEEEKELARGAIANCGMGEGYERVILGSLLGKSATYLDKFSKLSLKLREVGLSDYQHFLIARLISELTEKKIAVFEDIFAGFKDASVCYDSWCDILEDIAESLLSNRSYGLCRRNKIADALIRAQAN